MIRLLGKVVIKIDSTPEKMGFVECTYELELWSTTDIGNDGSMEIHDR